MRRTENIVPITLKSGSLNFLETSKTIMGIALLLHLLQETCIDRAHEVYSPFHIKTRWYL